MTTANQTILDNLSASVTKALTDLNAAQSKLNTLQAEAKELERQAEYHRSRNNQTDLNIVNGQLSAKYQEIAAQQGNVTNLKSVYDAAMLAYKNAMDNLLTPEEKQAALIKAQADAASEQNKLFAQKTTKYLIWGAVGLVIIVIGIIIYRKKYA